MLNTVPHVSCTPCLNKKLSCCRKTAQCFMLLNILLSHQGHSSSLKMTPLSRACLSLLVFHWNYVCISPRSQLRGRHLVAWLYHVGSSLSSSNNGVTLKSRLEVVQGHWKWCRLIDHIWLIISLPFICEIKWDIGRKSRFFPQMLCKRGLYRHAVCVHLSVCVSATSVHYFKMNKYIFKNFSPSGSHTILVFQYRLAIFRREHP